MENGLVLTKIAEFLFEAGILQKTPRSGFGFLGSGSQSVAEHLNRTAYIGYALAKMHGTADVGRTVEMCLFHDFTEARISDLNHVHQKYNERKEMKAVADLTASLPFGRDIKEIIEAYEQRESIEARLAKDADQLEMLLTLKELADAGNPRANEWLPGVAERARTEEGRRLAEVILRTDSASWWYRDLLRDQRAHQEKTAEVVSDTPGVLTSSPVPEALVPPRQS